VLSRKKDCKKAAALFLKSVSSICPTRNGTKRIALEECFWNYVYCWKLGLGESKSIFCFILMVG